MFKVDRKSKKIAKVKDFNSAKILSNRYKQSFKLQASNLRLTKSNHKNQRQYAIVKKMNLINLGAKMQLFGLQKTCSLAKLDECKALIKITILKTLFKRNTRNASYNIKP